MELNKEIVNIQRLKQLLREAFQFDYDKHQGKVEFYSFTADEWPKSAVYEKSLAFYSGCGTMIAEKPYVAAGSCFRELKIICGFLEYALSFEKTWQTKDEMETYYVKMVFHELFHYYDDVWFQQKSDNVLENFDVFVYEVQQFMMDHDSRHYREYHDEYMFETKANLYGIDRAYAFLESKGILTEKGAKLLWNIKNRCLFYLNNFDIHTFLEKLHEIVMANSEEGILNCWLSLFYKYDEWALIFKRNIVIFNSIDEILEEADDVDETILKCFFSSKNFLNSLDFGSLTLEDKQVVMNAIKWALEAEEERIKKNKELFLDDKVTDELYEKAQDKIAKKIAFLEKKQAELENTIAVNSAGTGTYGNRRR